MTAKKAPDLSEFYRLSRPKRPPCPVSLVIAELDPESEDGRKLLAAMAKPGDEITSAAIVQWLEQKGITLSNNAVATHRRNACRCRHD